LLGDRTNNMVWLAGDKGAASTAIRRAEGGLPAGCAFFGGRKPGFPRGPRGADRVGDGPKRPVPSKREWGRKAPAHIFGGGFQGGQRKNHFAPSFGGRGARGLRASYVSPRWVLRAFLRPRQWAHGPPETGPGARPHIFPIGAPKPLGGGGWPALPSEGPFARPQGLRPEGPFSVLDWVPGRCISLNLTQSRHGRRRGPQFPRGAGAELGAGRAIGNRWVVSGGWRKSCQGGLGPFKRGGPGRRAVESPPTLAARGLVRGDRPRARGGGTGPVPIWCPLRRARAGGATKTELAARLFRPPRNRRCRPRAPRHQRQGFVLRPKKKKPVGRLAPSGKNTGGPAPAIFAGGAGGWLGLLAQGAIRGSPVAGKPKRGGVGALPGFGPRGAGGGRLPARDVCPGNPAGGGPTFDPPWGRGSRSSRGRSGGDPSPGPSSAGLFFPG